MRPVYMKKIFAIVFSLMLLIVATGCGGNKDQEHADKKSEQKIVGISMPKKNSPRWIRDGDSLRYEFEKRGYKVDLQNAEDDAEKQRSQLKYMIENGADIIVIAAVDSYALSDILVGAKEKNIPVIAYDRLIMDSDAVSYYVSFDNRAVGMTFGKYIENSLRLNDGNGSFNAEIFSGSLDDKNSRIINEALFEVLQPYIDSGQLKIPSGQTAFNETATYHWLRENAQKRMNNLLETVYSDGTIPDALICASDSIANGIIRALEDHDYSILNGQPIITGQDADITAIRNIINDKQSMTLFKNTRLLAQKYADIVDAIVNGKPPEINDTESYNNGKIIVPAYLCDPIFVTKDNFKEELLDIGYYAAEDVGL